MHKNVMVMVSEETKNMIEEMAAYYRMPVFEVAAHAVNLLYEGDYQDNRDAYVERTDFEQFVRDNGA